MSASLSPTPRTRPTRGKELAATVVLAAPLVEASMKVRTGDPVDEPADVVSRAAAQGSGGES